ncbi:MAG TPA: hypothetical protein VMF09_06225 [Solirubrobacteraceae bacterium]|nr:hypothetical protein [Solirubrobacteraceae bacterium]
MKPGRSIESRHGVDEPGYETPRTWAQKLEGTGAKLQSAGKGMSSCGGSLIKLGCSGFLLLLVVLIVATLLLSGHSDSPTAGGTSTEEQATGAATTPTTPGDREAPTLDEGPAEDSAATQCGHGTTGNSHTSCAFAENVRDEFAAGYEASKVPPATISAYSPVTSREYTLHCSLVEGRTLVECSVGTATVVFPLEGTYNPHEGPARPSGLYGAQTKAENEEAGCMYGFTVSERDGEQKIKCNTKEEGRRIQEDEGDE